MAKELKELTKSDENYSQWYNDLVVKAGLAENSAVRGCMVIKPYGYAIWEKMHDALDRMFKETGHQNAYFPLFIPKSFFSKEANHVEGFAKECAVVTHYRLKNDPEGKGVVVDPDAKLEEELIVRPTSETIIWNTYKNWIQSYRDLPILCNQWANVVRWEMRTRLFLRTAEFLWQEGHTAHATREEAIEEAEKMIHVYEKFAQEWMAVPVVVGHKSPNERFAGAEDTLTIEALMQDGKALQSGTSHFLGQNFAKAFDVQYVNKEGKLEYVWATSWGVSTRLMGALIMAHSDNNGLVLPPRLAPIQVVMVPIYKTAEQLAGIVARFEEIAAELRAKGISVKIDDLRQRASGLQVRRVRAQGRARASCHGRPRHGERHRRTGAPRHARQADRRPGGARGARRAPDDRHPGEHLPQGAGLPRLDDYARRHVGGVQAGARREGRLRLGPLGRHGRDRGGHQGGDQGHDPLHPRRCRRRGGRLRLLGQAVAPSRALRPQLLVFGMPIRTAGVRREAGSGFFRAGLRHFPDACGMRRRERSVAWILLVSGRVRYGRATGGVEEIWFFGKKFLPCNRKAVRRTGFSRFRQRTQTIKKDAYRKNSTLSN